MYETNAPRTGARLVDLRSDTLTFPSPEMRAAMARAELGDDVFGEDPTVNRLERLAAETMGKESGLFVASGTMGNLVGVLAHTQRGDEVICGDISHVYLYEVAGCAVMGGLQMRPLPTRAGALDPAAVDKAIRTENIHHPRTGLVCLENTSNRAGGAAQSAAEMAAVAAIAHHHAIPVHLDGARVFNAAVYHGIPVREMVASVDSVTFCLSKGLAAPVGSVLCGPADYIQRARKYRKMVGGGMRQVGVIAAAGIVALESMVERLFDDHANARVLAEGLSRLPGLDVDLASIQTNIVAFNTTPEGPTAAELVERLQERGVLCFAIEPRRIRMVTHYGIERDDVAFALEAAKGALRRVPAAV